MMGDHRQNPRALEAAARATAPLPEEQWGGDLWTNIELNKETMAPVRAAVEEAQRAGEDPRQALHRQALQFNPMEHPEKFDLVIYVRASVMRPTRIALATNQQRVAWMLGPELWRVPLSDMRKRADELLNKHKDQQGPNLQ